MDDVEDVVLQHYGILGMKWGRRRARTDTSSNDYKTARGLKKKKVREMSNEELKSVANRLRLEKEYRTLNPTVASKGVKGVGSALGTIGKVAGGLAAVATLIANGQKIMDLAKKAKGG